MQQPGWIKFRPMCARTVPRTREARLECSGVCAFVWLSKQALLQPTMCASTRGNPHGDVNSVCTHVCTNLYIFTDTVHINVGVHTPTLVWDMLVNSIHTTGIDMGTSVDPTSTGAKHMSEHIHGHTQSKIHTCRDRSDQFSHLRSASCSRTCSAPWVTSGVALPTTRNFACAHLTMRLECSWPNQRSQEQPFFDMMLVMHADNHISHDLLYNLWIATYFCGFSLPSGHLSMLICTIRIHNTIYTI
jgi:hypothetical protein